MKLNKSTNKFEAYTELDDKTVYDKLKATGKPFKVVNGEFIIEDKDQTTMEGALK